MATRVKLARGDKEASNYSDSNSLSPRVSILPLRFSEIMVKYSFKNEGLYIKITDFIKVFMIYNSKIMLTYCVKCVKITDYRNKKYQ